MKIFIGSDHRGVEFKAKVLRILESFGYDATDCGTNDPEISCDYPKIAYKVATQVAKSKNNRGILVCMSGIGQAIAANKVKGIRAALVYNTEAAKLSRQHNDANILVLSSRFTKQSELKKIVQDWLTTEFEGGRHERRVNQMKKMERGMKI